MSDHYGPSRTDRRMNGMVSQAPGWTAEGVAGGAVTALERRRPAEGTAPRQEGKGGSAACRSSRIVRLVRTDAEIVE